MYIVKNSTGEIVAMASELKDALAIARGSDIDKTKYTVEKMVDK